MNKGLERWSFIIISLLSNTLLFGNHSMYFAEQTISPTEDSVFQDKIMKARMERKHFNLGLRDVTFLWGDKHNQSFRQLGLRKSLVLIVEFL